MLKKILPLLMFVWMGTCSASETDKAKEPVAVNPAASEEFVETTHQIIINGQSIQYKALAGNLLLRDENQQPTASLFFVSYTKQGVDNTAQRPITFCFNGGPGSSSLWLHVGVFGPKRVYLTEQGDALPPYHLVDNEFSLLDVTDLVFIDPVSTGFSRAIPPADAKKFHGVTEDIKSVADFIRLYTTRFNRWDSPKFLAGESYGTTRAAGLANYLHDNYYMFTNGILLISSVLNFQSIDFDTGNDLPYLTTLPTYTATAWYHKKLAPELQTNLYKTLEDVHRFIDEEYSSALFKGDLLPPQQREAIVNKLSRYTGLSTDYISRLNLRIGKGNFMKELLREQSRTVGRFDSRFKGIDRDSVGQSLQYDPSFHAIVGAFTSTMNHYLRTDLKWEKDSHYRILADVQPWDYGVAANQYLNVAEDLREVMTKNSHMRVYVANGLYDLATPYFATEYTFNHLGLDPSLRDHVKMDYYEAGHMMYIHHPSLVKMKNDMANFYLNTLQVQEQEENSQEDIHR